MSPSKWARHIYWRFCSRVAAAVNLSPNRNIQQFCSQPGNKSTGRYWKVGRKLNNQNSAEKCQSTSFKYLHFSIYGITRHLPRQLKPIKNFFQEADRTSTRGYKSDMHGSGQGTPRSPLLSHPGGRPHLWREISHRGRIFSQSSKSWIIQIMKLLVSTSGRLKEQYIHWMNKFTV